MARTTYRGDSETRTAQLEARSNELTSKRQDLLAELGASVYNQIKDDLSYREGRERLFDSIAAIDEEYDQIEAELQHIQLEAEADQATNSEYTCPHCGLIVPAGDMFCSGCGTPVGQDSVEEEAEAEAEVDQLHIALKLFRLCALRAPIAYRGRLL